jgi:hypothetical protein
MCYFSVFWSRDALSGWVSSGERDRRAIGDEERRGLGRRGRTGIEE